MSIEQFLIIGFASIFVSNVLLAKFLGLCPFIGVTQKIENAIGMGAAVTFVMFLASFVTFLLYRTILVPHDLVLALQTPMFILVIAALVQLVELFMRSRLPALYEALGIFLPLITTNCAVMGVALLNAPYPPLAQQPSLGAGLAIGLLDRHRQRPGLHAGHAADERHPGEAGAGGRAGAAQGRAHRVRLHRPDGHGLPGLRRDGPMRAPRAAFCSLVWSVHAMPPASA